MTLSSLPPLWRAAQIGQLTLPVATADPRALGSGTFRYVDISSVDNQTKTIVDPAIVSNADAPIRARQAISANDVLVSTVRPRLNAVAIVPEHLDGEICSTGFCVLRPDQNHIVPEYLFAWVGTRAFVQMLARLERGLSYPAVSDGDIKSQWIPLPPLPEQQRIAAILHQADELHLKRGQANARTAQLRRALFRHLFGRIAAPDTTWSTIRVDEAGNVQLGRQRAPKYQTGRFSRHYLRVANVFEDHIDLSDVLSMDFDQYDFETYRLEDRDILLNEGQSTELVGRPAMWRNELPDVCFQNTLIRFRPDASKVNPEFALAVFLEYFYSGEFSKRSSKTSNVAHLSASRFANMSFPLPPLELQEQFGSLVTAIRQLQGVQSTSLKRISELRASIQAQAFTGQLTAAWREKHVAELHDAAVQRDVALGLRMQEPRLIDFKEGRITQAEREEFDRRVREALVPAAQQLVDAAPRIEQFFRDLNSGPLVQFAKLIENMERVNQQLVDGAVFRAVTQFTEGVQRTLAAMEPKIDQTMLAIQQAGKALEQRQAQIQSFLAAAEKLTSAADLALRRPGTDDPRHYLLKELSEEQYLAYLTATTADGPFTARTLAGNRDISTVERHLETLASLGLVAKLSVVVSPTPDATYYVSAFRGLRDEDDPSPSDIERLKAGLQ